MSSTVSSCGGEAVETLVTEFDVAIIGGGIVGLATAVELAERAPGRRLAVLEKEPHLAAPPIGTEQRRHPLRSLLPSGVL